jgi:hypothetical protein
MTVLKTVTASVVRNAVTTIGCLKKTACCVAWSSSTWHHIVWHIIYNTAPANRKHVLMCNATNHLADYSEYCTMNVTWYRDLKLCKLFVVFTFCCYGVLADKPNCMLRNVSKLFATIHNSVIFILMYDATEHLQYAGPLMLLLQFTYTVHSNRLYNSWNMLVKLT